LDFVFVRLLWLKMDMPAVESGVAEPLELADLPCADVADGTTEDQLDPRPMVRRKRAPDATAPAVDELTVVRS
jgi:hypothetical protein